MAGQLSAPYRYSGETLGKVNRQDLIGDYQFINHGKDISRTIRKSTYIHLNKNNSISGDVMVHGRRQVTINAELNIRGQIYKACLVRQWNPTSERYDS